MKNNYLTGALAVLLLIAAGFAYYTQDQKKKKEAEVEALKKEIESLSKLKVKSANPFDNPNSDPLAAEVKTDLKPTSISFEKTRHSFGRIAEGDMPKTTFRFTNTGKEPLIINSAVASCGCTVANWPRGPIAPGESSVIDVAFDSKKKSGEVTKTVTVTANTVPPKTVLYINGTVIPKQQ